METYPPLYLSSSSSPPSFMAMNTSSHHRAISEVGDHGELISGGWFLGLTPSTGSHRAPSNSSNDNNIEGVTDHDSLAHKSLVFEGSEIGEPTNAGRKKGDPTADSKMKGKVRKPRYAFQTRSHVDILDDGYRWRKYGQKAVKNNKFPRSYYRCTVQGCNVKKQVQRLTGDEGIVVTTYEGMHSHPIERSTDNFEHILSQFRIYTST